MRAFWQTLLFWTLLGGCNALNTVTAHGYKWTTETSYPICPSYEWAVRDSISVQRICDSANNHHPYVLGCSFVANACLVVSMYSEEQAKLVYLPGTDWSHQQHEVEGHIKNRWGHP